MYSMTFPPVMSLSGIAFSQPGAYVTHNAMSPLSDITGGNLSDTLQPSLEPQATLYHPKSAPTGLPLSETFAFEIPEMPRQ